MPPPPAVGFHWRAYGAVVVALRLPLLLAWVAAAAAATIFLPPLTPSGSVTGLVPAGAPALQAEAQASRLFGLPLAAQADVVQRDPRGFSLQTQVQAARLALAVDRGQVPGILGLAGALPVANTAGLFPGSRERSTTIITYLFFHPDMSVAAQAAEASAFARRFDAAPQDHLVGVTGPAPAEEAQAALILRYLPWVELATLLAIGLIVGIYFRALGAPLATLSCAAIAYLVAVRVVAWAARRAGVVVAPDVEPVLVVLLLGVTTDYSVFFLAGMRSRLAEGLSRSAAARQTTAEYAPIIATAGLVVAAGVASLLVARLGPLRAFGPVLAVTVLIAMVVAITLAPALIAIFGRLLFLPGPAWFGQGGGAAGRAAPARGRAAPAAVPARVGAALRAGRWREWSARMATTRAVALLVAALCVVGLLVAASGLRQMRLGYPLVLALPASSQPVQADNAAAAGFAPGILSPTEVLVIGKGVALQGPALARLQQALARQSGVAGVVGPTDLPSLESSAHIMVARSGNAARYAVIERTDALGPAAIDRVRTLRHNLPSLVAAAGLRGVRFEVGGETALAGEAIDATQADLGRIAVTIAAVIAVLLAVFLGAVVAPLYLLAASVLALLSALGLTVWVFQGLLGYPSLVYYVPFVVAVLLVSLGSDYNVFVVGRIWEEARRQPLREAVAVAVPRASRAITTAGLALAAGFGLLALVPLQQFREIAVAMVTGIVIDTFIVRSLLVPSLVVLFGRVGTWPHRGIGNRA
ncbi:MAG TPA: MMPL family transporter [Streptosporangiaceae bacterium]|nr:MMPL family transporter [Streptosporangiaceae bacterium]